VEENLSSFGAPWQCMFKNKDFPVGVTVFGISEQYFTFVVHYFYKKLPMTVCFELIFEIY
jgi:hypothetical protein